MKKFNNSSRINQVDRFGDIVYEQYSVGFGIVDMSTESSDYRVDSTGVSAEFMPKYFYLVPETVGIVVVELEGMGEGDTYTITAAQVDAYLGKALPYKIRRVVKTGTTATFSVVW